MQTVSTQTQASSRVFSGRSRAAAAGGYNLAKRFARFCVKFPDSQVVIGFAGVIVEGHVQIPVGTPGDVKALTD